MKKFLLTSLIALSATSVFAFQLENPSEMKWGGKFSHYSCEKFSTTASATPNSFAAENISFNEFGINKEMKYGVFNVFYGENKSCEYRVQLTRNKVDATLTFDKSEATETAECSVGHQLLDKLFTEGMTYAETGRGHRNLSFNFFSGVSDNTCSDAAAFNLEFHRIR